MNWNKFRVHIQLTGITQKQIAEVLADYFGTEYKYDDKTYTLMDSFQREWNIRNSPEIDSERMLGSKRVKMRNFFYQSEIVSPLLYSHDADMLRDIVDDMNERGALINPTTKTCINIETTRILSKERYLENLRNIEKSKGELLQKSLNCERSKLFDTKQFEENGIVSFPIFQSSVKAEDIISNIQLAQCVNKYANRKNIIRDKQNASENDKFVLRTWLVRIGMIGEEYGNARKKFTKDLEGNSAWINKIETKTIQEEPVNSSIEVTDNTEVESSEQSEPNIEAGVLENKILDEEVAELLNDEEELKSGELEEEILDEKAEELESSEEELDEEGLDTIQMFGMG